MQFDLADLVPADDVMPVALAHEMCAEVRNRARAKEAEFIQRSSGQLTGLDVQVARERFRDLFESFSSRQEIEISEIPSIFAELDEDLCLQFSSQKIAKSTVFYLKIAKIDGFRLREPFRRIPRPKLYRKMSIWGSERVQKGRFGNF